MGIFFFVVGLEIKREFLAGELASPKTAALPIFGALEGVLAPALIYLAINPSREASLGWCIPMATDIVFASGILTLFPVSISLKVFLTVLAIVDDIGAILVVAIFYTDDIARCRAWQLAVAFSWCLSRQIWPASETRSCIF